MATPAPQQKPTGKNGYGITNAQIHTSDERFTNRAEERLSRARFLKGNELREGAFAANDPLYDQGVVSQESSQSVKIQRALIEDEALRQLGEPFTGSDLEAFRGTAPTRPDFPFLVLFVALLKDLLDIIGAVTLVGWILLLPLSVCLSILLFFWTFSRLRLSYMKKHRLLKIIIRLIAFGVEMFGIVNVVPLATFFVLFTHYDETKVVKTIFSALETFAKIEGRIGKRG